MNTGIVFDLYEDEEIKYILRRHWLAFTGTIAIVFGMLLLFFVGLIVASVVIDSSGNGGINISENFGRGALIVFGSIYLLSVIGYFYIAWLDYYMDIFILTNKRIIRLEQLVLFGQRVSETNFQHIQDVSSKVQGLLQTFFAVGTVFVETAGERENFSFTTMKDPGMIAAWIMEAQHNIWGKELPELGNPIKTDLAMNRKNENLQKIEMRKIHLKHESLEDAIKDKLLIPKKIIDKLLHRDSHDPEDIPTIFAPNAERPTMPAKKELPVVRVQAYYKDGRKIIPEGVIWESEQYLTAEVLGVLNSMESDVLTDND